MNFDNPYPSHSRHTDWVAHPRTNNRRNSRLKALGSITAGSALALFGASRKSLAGAAVAGLGGFLVYRGLRETRHHVGPIHVERSFTINKPVEEIFSFWRNFENLPRFMRHLNSVKTTGERQSHWEARGPLKTSIGWDAEITDEQPNRFIVWKSLPGSVVDHRGSVEFRPAEHHGGTAVTVALDYQAPAGKLGQLFFRMFGEDPEQQVRDDLRRFKQLMEAGEIPTTEGQSSGRRTPFVRMVQAATAERTTMRERSA